MSNEQKTLAQRLQEARKDFNFQAQLARCAGQPATAEGPPGRFAGYVFRGNFYSFTKLPPEKS